MKIRERGRREGRDAEINKKKIKSNSWEMLIILVQVATVDFSKLDMKLLF